MTSITLGQLVELGQVPIMVLMVYFLWKIDRAILEQQTTMKSIMEFVIGKHRPPKS